jgi:hypothetical protein
VELSRPIDLIPQERAPRTIRSPYRQSSADTSSRITIRSMASRWRSSVLSVNCPQIPPLDLGEEITFWSTSQFISGSMEPSPVLESSSSHSGRNSVISRASASTSRSSFRPRGGSVSSEASSSASVSQRTIRQRPESQRSDRFSILLGSIAFMLPSPLKLALTTRETVWMSAGIPRFITKATMEGLIHNLLRSSAGKRYTPFRVKKA